MAHQARKRFGQNFLTDPLIIDSIIRNLQLKANDRLIEIGPGLGALTQPLLAQLDQLSVIEIDRDLIEKLQQWPAYHSHQLTIHAGDVLTIDFPTLTEQLGRPCKLVGNLPYNISTPLLIKLLPIASQFESMVFMLQKEIVDRITAQPGSKTFGRLSVLSQYHCQTTRLFEVPPEAFSPPPKVQSACLKLVAHSHIEHPVRNLKHFESIVQIAFAHRRKTLHNNFKELKQTIPWEKLGLDPSQRAEQLSVADFVALSNQLDNA